MKIYILRHEDRTQDCSFFAPLTKKGLDNSIKLVNLMSKCNIGLIYCSPFIRTLQTVYPYAKEKNLKINLEYGISEIHNEDIIPKKAVGISLPEYLAECFNYQPDYKTIIKPTEIVYPEQIKDISLRVMRVLRKIIESYAKSDESIVLVTHQSLCAEVLKIINNSVEFKNKLEPTVINNYEKGKLSLIYDNGWTFKPINNN